MAPQSRPSLSGQLDKDVYQIVLKMIAQDDEVKIARPSEVYNFIKNSNSSLARKQKKQLEDSIGRVLQVIQVDLASDSEANDNDNDPVPEESVDANIMNRHITAQWSKPPKRDAAAQESNQESTALSKSKKKLTNGEPPRKRPRIFHTPPSGMSLTDLGGIGPIAAKLKRLLVLPLLFPEDYHTKGMLPPRGILLHGPPGCGKTTIANAFATSLGVPLITISAPSITSGISGESEQFLRDHFEEAKKLAPCLMLIDEIDTIGRKRESAQRDMERRIVTQLMTCMDDLAIEKTGRKPVIVIATTNYPDSLDPALRGGRFDNEIGIGIPKEPAREKILRALTRDLDLADDINLGELAKQTPGFVGADLRDLVKAAISCSQEAKLQALEDRGKESGMDLDDDDIDPEITSLFRVIAAAKLPRIEGTVAKITNTDFLKALPEIQPAVKREGFATVPNTTWEDIGALEGIRESLKKAITEPMLNPQKYARVGITAPSGVLLYGPPGCGKTLLAKAVANESRANFISIKGPELLNKFVGESERAVRQVFSRARASAPCLVFFDEIDALAATRDDGTGGSNVRVVNTLLTELDGLENREGVYVIAATNRKDTIDPALLRPGRLERLFFVDLPKPTERVAILRTILRGINVEFNEVIQKVAEDCEGFSGADLASLARQAGEHAIDRDDIIRPEDFIAARKNVKRSVADPRKYLSIEDGDVADDSEPK